MRRFTSTFLLLAVGVAPLRAQDALTNGQRVSDLTELASQYAKNYGPYEWKRDVQGFDLLRLTPWLQRIQHVDDLDFQEALIEYVASLNDAHDTIAFPTTFSASLPMSVDIYDGTVLIDSINRTLLPLANFPFGVGDELVALDSRPAQEWIQAFRKDAISAKGRTPVFPIGLLPQRSVQTNRFRRGRRQLHVVDELRRPRIVNKQLHRFPNAASGFVHGPALRVAAAHLANRSHPPTRLVSLVSDVVSTHDSSATLFPDMALDLAF